VAELTVIVPVHNGSAHLDSALTSLAMQRGPAIDVIVVDDGSTDDSALKAERHGVDALVIKQPNRGVAAARNRGLAEASSTWVAFLDQDDLWHPDRASILMALADRTGRLAVATTEMAFALESDRAALRLVGDGREDWPSHWLDSGTEIDVLLLSDVGEQTTSSCSPLIDSCRRLSL
jgi:glycosyltransferase involved in cell wall biosynthesis